MPNTIRDIFIAADELLDSPEKWTQGAYARSSSALGFLMWDDPEAVSWCLEGACRKASSWNAGDPIIPAIVELERQLGTGSIAQFNDSPDTTFDDVKAVLKEAIRNA